MTSKKLEYSYLDIHSKQTSISSAISSISRSSLAVSVMGSWDEEEQDYDARARKKVTEMIDQLDNLLYDDKPHNIENPSLIDECSQWTGLYSHIRYIYVVMVALVAFKCRIPTVTRFQRHLLHITHHIYPTTILDTIRLRRTHIQIGSPQISIRLKQRL